MVLVDMGWTGKEIAKYTTVIVGLMAVGTLMPITVLPKGIKVKYCLYLSILQILLMTISAIFYNNWLFIISAFFISFAFFN